MTCVRTNHGEAPGRADPGGEYQETEADGEVRHDERREQDALQPRL